MSFLNPEKEQSSSMKIHVRTYRWSGGEKPIDRDDPLKGKRAYAEIKWREGSGDNAIKGTGPIPMDLAVLGVTFSLSGFDSSGTAQSNVSYFSNETTKWGQPLKVWKRDARGVQLVAEGEYAVVKEKLGKLIHSQYNVYFYNFERNCIDCFAFVGSPYGVWKDYDKGQMKQQKYTAFTRVSEGNLEQYPTGMTILPKLELLTTPYTPEQVAKIKEFAPKMDEYEKFLESKIAQNEPNDVDQTPTYYDGDASQEYQEAPAVDYTGMGGIPF